MSFIEILLLEILLDAIDINEMKKCWIIMKLRYYRS